MKNEKVLNTIEEAIEDFRQGKIVIVVDAVRDFCVQFFHRLSVL